LASLVEFAPCGSRRRNHILVDPCAGNGEALGRLAALWFPERGTAGHHLECDAYAIELERGRFQALEKRLPGARCFRGDAFHFIIAGAQHPGDGSSLLFLNPPYDVDRIHGRLEQRFLERWTSCLAPGAGILVFVVPHYALAASAEHLSRHFDDVRAWRFPGSHFDAFKQCFVLARRRAVVAAENDVVRRRIDRWATDASLLPELTEPPAPIYTVTLDRPQLYLQQAKLDLPTLLADYRPWQDSTLVASHRTVRDIIGAPCRVALPPQPAHIALALAAGTLNGRRVTADRPGLPPLLLKGSFRRDFVTAEEKFNKDGEKVGSIQIQRPRLTIHVLRLDTLDFHELACGSLPSGATDIASFNTADLVEHYGVALRDLMRHQFPAIHDPADPSHAMTLPRLARRPYRRQAQLISAGLKLLALGENPLLAAEVGTGKSTVALSIAGALHPLHFAHTTAELRRLGFETGRMRPILRTLIVCPPHLLKSWADQVASVLPLHRVVVADSLADLDSEGEVFLLSRETAKLGHGVEGVSGRCPRCGSEPRLATEALASTRARCGHRTRTPRNRSARLAERLAAVLCQHYPFDPHVRDLVRRHRVLSLSLPSLPGEDEPIPAATPPPPEALRPLVRELLETVERRLLDRKPSHELEGALHRLCLAAELQEDVRDQLMAAAGRYEQTLDDLRTAAGDDLHSELYEKQQVQGQLERLAARIISPRPTYGTSADALACLEALVERGRWLLLRPCGEPLFQATPNPRRYPLARYILKHQRGRFQLLVLDEAHEFSKQGSAQQKAAHRLVELPGVPTLALSGSLMGGYASSLFANFWALSRAFRRQFHRSERQVFVTRFGYRKLYVPAGSEGKEETVGYGATSDREEIQEAPEIRQIGEAPGILPSFILEHLLPTALIMHKGDLEDELPPCIEVPVPVAFSQDDPRDRELREEYNRVMRVLVGQIKRDSHTALAGKLWGAMSEAPSYLDRCTDDLPPFVLRYPADAGGHTVVEARMFPATWLTPKERAIVQRLRQHLAAGHNVLLFLRHTGKSGLPARYQRILQLHLGERAVFLDVNKVSAAKREEWLNNAVIEPRRRILITNPKAVQTGLNNLVHFSRAIWIEGVDYDARVVRQANGRVHRIGQVKDVAIEVPFYQRTAQETALDLVARKVTASVQVDGLSIEGALESAGAGDDDASIEAAMGMGQAIYEAWLGR
jgi:uncharacterized methyltransferase DUF6094